MNHYRNKDEFNFRIGLDGDPKTLGFFTGRPQFGEIYAIRPTNLINVKEEHKLVGKVNFNCVSMKYACDCLEWAFTTGVRRLRQKVAVTSLLPFERWRLLAEHSLEK